ncbi:MAG: cation:proton antiporter [Bacteroidota bacterium]
MTVTTLPLQEPLLIFTVLIGIILLSPFLFRVIKIPEVASFIIMGILVGPYGFNILSRDSSIELLGTVGLLYLMFMTGLELDPEKLKTSRKNSIVFGLATFLLPFVLGVIISKTILKLDIHATLLVSIMFSTHTLIAYPIVRKLGVTRDASVLTAVGGTIITDTLVLIILSVVTQGFKGNSIGFEASKLLLYFGGYTIFIFYSFPKIARWFFKHIKRDRPVHFLFLLFMVCISSALAELIGVEAIIGAFLAGLALNKSIPRNSLLMHHVDFVGNVLFIPVFLIGIGMLIDTRVIFTGTHLWFVAAVFIVTAFTGKWLAAYFSQKTLNFNVVQRNLLFGLTSSRVAASLAVILIGYEKQIIDITIFNAVILIIFVSSLGATLITEKYGKKLALSSDFTRDEKDPERILVPISNPSTMANLVGIANRFNTLQTSDPVYVLNILDENRSSRENILRIREILEKNVSEFNNLNESLKVITRVDLSISSGIIRAAKEYMVSDIIFGLGEKTTASERIFGNIFDHLLNGLQTLFAVKIEGNLSEYRRFVVNIPANLEHEPSFFSVIRKINKLPDPDNELEFRVENDEAVAKIRAALPKRNRHKITYSSVGFNVPEGFQGTVNILFLMRKQSVSFHAKNNNMVHKAISSNSSNDYIVVVPGFEQ